MTRLYYQMGHLRLRMLLILLACIAVFGAANLLAYWRFMEIGPEQLRQQIILFAVLLSAIFLILGAYIFASLAPVATLLHSLRRGSSPHPKHEELARKAAIRFPLSFCAVAFITCLVGIVVALVVDMAVFRLDSALTVSLAMATTAEVMVTCAFMYVVAKRRVRPIMAHLGNEEIPQGIRVGLQSKILVAIISLVLAATIPTALIFGGRLKHMQQQVQDAHQLQLAESIAYGSTVMSSEDLGQAIAAIHLSNNGRVRLQDTAGAALPAHHIRPYIAVQADPPPTSGTAVLFVLILLLLALAVFVGRSLGGSLAQNVAMVSDHIMALAEAKQVDRDKLQPLLAEAPLFSDLRRLASALNHLLSRIIKINVTYFLSVEKTIEADRVKTQFLANVSHDLRSPLNSVLGFSGLLLSMDGETLTEGQREQLEVIHRNGKDLLGLINEVLDAAKIEAGRVELAREECIVAEILSQTLKEVHKRGLPESIDIESELQAGMKTVTVDPQRLTQALANIITFCAESMERGRLVVKIQIRHLAAPDAEAQTNRVLRIHVANLTGSLGESEVRLLFSGFRRKSGQRGLGLGLPIARSFIELHGGTMNVTSTPGLGTSFTVDIPMLEPTVLARMRP